MNILEIAEKKQKKQKISMVTCYDYTSAQIVAETNIDMVLVGDSAAMTMHGEKTTINCNVSMMALHTRAVARGCPQKFIVADLPFLSFRKSRSEFISACEKLMKAGAHAVKLEGALGNLDLIQHAVESGIPVMGHLGLTPQFFHILGGFKVQGRDEESKKQIFDQAKMLETAGCFSLVLECVPGELAQKVTQSLKIPTIGIGAGNSTDGQVLVFQDLLGLGAGKKLKFVRNYFDGRDAFKKAIDSYHADVLNSNFPSKAEEY